MARGTQQDINQAVIRRINAFMKKQAEPWTMHKLAIQAGIPSQSLYDILNGKQKTISIQHIKKVCDAFGVTVTEFFDTTYFKHLPME